jgi:hypothetical protein
MTEEEKACLLKILRYYIRESTNVLADPRHFDPTTVAVAKRTLKGLTGGDKKS